MSEFNRTDAAREAIAPLSGLYDENKLLASSVDEAFAEVEAMFAELAEWEQNLFALESELEDKSSQPPVDSEEAREDLARLESENAQQLQALEDLERDHAAALGELATVREQAAELTELLAAQRAQAEEHHQQWMAELQAVRATIDRGPPAAESAGTDVDFTPVDDPPQSGDGSAAPGRSPSRAAQLRQRAKAQRIAKRST